MRFAHSILLAAVVLLLAACVPSPTATPPRATPFPTIPPLPTDTPLPTVTLTAAPTPLPPTRPGGAPTLAPTVTATPRPTASATLVSAVVPPLPTPSSDTLALTPLLQVFPSSGGPVSANQPVIFGLLAAANKGLSRIELYDETTLSGSVAAPNPPPRFFSSVLSWRPKLVGPHHLRLVAYDSLGNVSAPVELTYDVVNDNHVPTALITNYVGQIDQQVGAPVLLQGVATDEVAITRVELYVDDLAFSFVEPDNRPGVSPLPLTFTWVPTTPGIHKLYLRAHDNQDQTGDSPMLLVNAIVTQSPAVAARYERDEVNANGTLLVYALAMSPNNITRVELWADDQLSQVSNSGTPDGQEVMDTTLVWGAGGAPGDHSLLVRAFDRSGLSTSTEAHLVHVLPLGAPLATPTPTRPGPTPTANAPTPAPTPEVLVPAPPTIALSTSPDPGAVQFPGPLHIRMTAHGSAELNHFELWAFYEADTTPELLYADSVKGSTDKVINFDWSPPRAGVAYLYARIVDQLSQVGKSAVLPVYLSFAPAPLPTPAFASLAPRWTATIPTNRFDISFVQVGRALRGSLTNTPVNSSPFVGSIVAGDLIGDRLTFAVQFSAQDASPRALDFDCLVSASPGQLACNYQDQAGNRGSALFQVPADH